MSYGQFSGNRVGHLRIGDQVPSGAVKYKRVGHNRILWEDAEGVRHYRLIHTDVLTADPKSAIYTIDYDGFHTRTTSAAIGEALTMLLPEGYDGHSASTFPKRKDSKRHTLRLHEVGPPQRTDGHVYRPFIRTISETEFEESITFRLTPNGRLDILFVDGKEP